MFLIFSLRTCHVLEFFCPVFVTVQKLKHSMFLILLCMQGDPKFSTSVSLSSMLELYQIFLCFSLYTC